MREQQSFGHINGRAGGIPAANQFIFFLALRYMADPSLHITGAAFSSYSVSSNN
jgi:hypothetical protein